MSFSVQSGCHVWDTCIVRQEESTIKYDVTGNEPMLYLLLCDHSQPTDPVSLLPFILLTKSVSHRRPRLKFYASMVCFLWPI